MPRCRTCLAFALLLTMAGCDEPLSLPLQTTEAAAPSLGTTFDPMATGNIEGQVAWSGPVPAVAQFLAPLSTGSEGRDVVPRSWSNPHAPVVEPSGHGVRGAVVFLEGVEPDHARPWDLPPVQVEIKDGQFHIHQGGAVQRAGVVRRGDTVAMVSRERWFEILQAREAAFFSIAFPEPGPLRTRRLQDLGLVELISGAGHYWMRGHLFVVAHPYYAVTDAAGWFTLPQVPPGEYRLACWHPNWRPARYERDIGTLLYTHMKYHSPLEVVRSVRVERGRTTHATFSMSAADFSP